MLPFSSGKMLEKVHEVHRLKQDIRIIKKQLMTSFNFTVVDYALLTCLGPFCPDIGHDLLDFVAGVYDLESIYFVQ